MCQYAALLIPTRIGVKYLLDFRKRVIACSRVFFEDAPRYRVMRMSKRLKARLQAALCLTL